MAKEGDSPVDEIVPASRSIPSTMGLENPCGNPGGPSSKAKYYSATDSVQVPRGKGEKNPDKGSEIESATVSLQNSRRTMSSDTSDGVPFV